MRWTIDQLNRIYRGIQLDESVTFDDEIKDIKDIIRIDPVIVTGYVNVIGDDMFMFSINVKTTMFLECAVTLDEVPYEIDFDDEIIFAPNTELDEDVFLINGITVDLKHAIWSVLLVHKPMKVVKEGSEDIYMCSEEAQLDIEKRAEEANNPFIELAKNFKEED